jgi:hypothetical protein
MPLGWLQDPRPIHLTLTPPQLDTHNTIKAYILTTTPHRPKGVNKDLRTADRAQGHVTLSIFPALASGVPFYLNKYNTG